MSLGILEGKKDPDGGPEGVSLGILEGKEDPDGALEGKEDPDGGRLWALTAARHAAETRNAQILMVNDKLC